MEAIDFWFKDLKANWAIFTSKKRYFLRLIPAIAYFLIVTFLFKKYLIQYEKIQGVQLYDILLHYFQAQDVSIYIFVILYTVVIYNFLFLLAYPRMIVSFFIFYSTGLLIRFLMLSFINLEPPLLYQFFTDPVLSYSTYKGFHITKDLFFSGHMVTIFTCYFTMLNKKVRFLFLISSIVLALLLIIQHIHYTIDILGAYIVVFLLYRVYYLKMYQNSRYNYQYSPEIIQV